MTFPDPEGERELDVFTQLSLDRLADVFNRRIIEDIVEGLVVEEAEGFLDGPFQFAEIDDHAGTLFAFDDYLDLIGMAMQRTALVVPRQEMSAIDIVYNAKLHQTSCSDP